MLDRRNTRLMLAQAVGQVDHRRLELEHVHPVRMGLLERHRLAHQGPPRALEEPAAGQAPPALMIREPDAFPSALSRSATFRARAPSRCPRIGR